MLDYGKLTVALARQDVPLDFLVNVEALNPAENKVTAKMIRLGWALHLNDKETINGVVDTAAVMEPGKPVVMPMRMRVNRVQFFNGPAQDMVALAAAVAGLNPDPTKISLKASPTVETPLGPLAYPNPITIVPLLVVLDDCHWCDPDTAAMLHYLVRRLDRSPILWYVTYAPGLTERDAPVARVLRALRATPSALPLQLKPLTVDDVWVVVRELGRLSAGTSGRRLAGRVHEVTGGNPFYLIELLKTLLARGWVRVHPETGEWIVSEQVTSDTEVGTMPPTVQGAIGQRVARLSDDLHAVLIVIAASGHGCTTHLLSHVHGISRLRAAVLGDALAERYLVCEDQGRYRCAHSIIAAVVLESVRPARRRELHRAIALAMIAADAEGGPPADPGQVAHHAHQGGERGLAYDHAMRACTEARQGGAFEEALGWLDLAALCAAGPDQTGTVDRETARLLEVAGWVVVPPAARRASGGVLFQQDFDLTSG